MSNSKFRSVRWKKTVQKCHKRDARRRMSLAKTSLEAPLGTSQLSFFSRMETKQDFQDELERYRILLAETTDPVGRLLLKDIISEMEEIERKWDDLRHRP